MILAYWFVTLSVNGIYPDSADDSNVYFCCGWDCDVFLIFQVQQNWSQIQTKLQVQSRLLRSQLWNVETFNSDWQVESQNSGPKIKVKLRAIFSTLASYSDTRAFLAWLCSSILVLLYRLQKFRRLSQF